MTEPNQDYRAIDAVVNIWTPKRFRTGPAGRAISSSAR